MHRRPSNVQALGVRYRTGIHAIDSPRIPDNNDQIDIELMCRYHEQSTSVHIEQESLMHFTASQLNIRPIFFSQSQASQFDLRWRNLKKLKKPEKS
jgi:hypothetical protein